VQISSTGPNGLRINYGEGLTKTEKLLKYLGERSFLRFWSHANPHIAPGKELSDLLVVCGNFVIVFSDKAIDYRLDRGKEVAWRHWYREAVNKSVRQLIGAARHLLQLRTPIYKDREATVELGLPLPPNESAKLHLVAVVNDSRSIDEADPPRPFLSFDSSISGNQHVDEGAIPFLLGDISPATDFVHVIDLAGLQEILTRLDTVTDFARYLDARKAFLRHPGRNTAANELCLVTRFVFSFDSDGNPVPLDAANPGFTRLGNGERLAASTIEDLRTREEANRVSYLWDDLIARQADAVENQTLENSNYNEIQVAEEVVRQMALEPRLKRRILSNAWREACLISAEGQVLNLRTIPHGEDSKTTYIFLTAAKDPNDSNDEYRARRLNLLQEFVLASLHEHPTTEIVIGFASELGQVPDSRDHVYFNAADEEDQEALASNAKASWEYKRSIFEAPRQSAHSVRDVPRLTG
jgi:hypothetical protein